MSGSNELTEFVEIPAGRACVGSTAQEVERAVEFWCQRLDICATQLQRWFSKELPTHRVDVASVLMQRVPLTRRVAGTSEDTRGDHPLIVSSATVAEELVASIRTETGVPFRVPSEAEWEWAARADTRSEYPWGSNFDRKRCNTREAGFNATCSVLLHPGGESPFGVLDLAGNVEEWTSTVYGPHPRGQAVADDLGASGGYRVCKGGSFEGHGDLARVARRHGWIGEHKAYGVRLVVDASSVSASEAQDCLQEWSSNRQPYAGVVLPQKGKETR